MSYLSKKERKNVSKWITEKLLAMGVKDEITYTGSGKKRSFYKRDDKGQIITEENASGVKVPKLFEIEMPIAMNVLRRTVKTLRNQPPETIEAFLNMPDPQAPAPESSSLPEVTSEK